MSESTVTYKKAATWQTISAPAATCIPTLFVILMTFASYVAVGIYGATTVIAGSIITGTRIFDAVTDPIIGLLSDRLNGKLGRARPLMILGYTIMSVCVLSLFKFGVGGGEGRLWVFTALYIIYIIGYTIFNVGAGLISPILTNDPKQRPLIGRWATVYITILSTMFSVVLSMTLMPKHNYKMGLPLFSDLCTIVVIAGFILLAITVITLTIAKVDVPASYVGMGNEKVKFKDMLDLMVKNRALQMYTAAAASDKLALQVASNSAITVMVFGIIIGDYTFNGKLNLVNMIVTLVLLLFFVGRLAGNSGMKKAVQQWTSISIISHVAMFIFMIAVNTLTITTNPVLRIGFTVLFAVCGASKMACTCVTDPMRIDVLDYELSRSGRYMPAVINTTYSFIDKIISSFSATIIAVVVAMIGYTAAMPQATDPLTAPIFNVAMFLWLGMPVIGWICTLIAMKFYPLTKEEMEKVQKRNAEIRAAALE